MGGVSFGITADGQPGYKKAGADTVIPFKGTPEYIATVDMVYSGDPSQRHNLVVTTDMSKYKTLIIATTTGITVTDVTIYSGPGEVVSHNEITYPVNLFNGSVANLAMGLTIIKNASSDTVVSFVHYGTGLGKAIVYGL